jgi:RNA polymerase sigma-70 factor (ECF subfamily)
VSFPENLSTCTDEELLDRLRRGNAAAFGVLLRRYERELYGYLRRYLGDDTLAEDVFQNTFLQVYLKCGQYETGRVVRPWLYTIATNQAIDATRRRRRHQAVSLEQAHETSSNGEAARLMQALESPSPGPMEQAASAEDRVLIRTCVDRLPEHLRQTLILAYYQGLKYREIADILGIPVGTVKSRLHAALGKFHELWSAATTPTPTPT